MPKRIKKRKAALEAVVKQDVFEVVMEILKTHGTKNLTLDIVARKVGMATSTLYNYFKNKADLLAYIVVRLFEPILREIDDIAEGDRPVVAKLRLIARLYLRANDEQNALLELLNKESSIEATKSIKEIQQTRKLAIARMMKIMEEGIRQGILRKASAIHLMLGFTGTIQAFLGYRTICDSKSSIEKDADSILEMFLEGARAK